MNEGSLSIGVTPGELEVRNSAIHGRGIFALRDLPAGRTLIEYVGRRISKEESLRLCQQQNPYVFQINEAYDLDGSVDWNPARFINHSCDPNCETEQDDDDRVWIASLRPIRAGEELTYNYCYDLEDYRDHPCSCRAANCVGYMVAEEFVPMIRRALKLRAEAEAELAGGKSGMEVRAGAPARD